MGCRFADSDEAAAIVDKFFYCSDDRFVYPVLATALCSICIAYVDHNIKVFQQILIFQDIIKADEGNIKRCAAQSLDDPEIRIILFVINCVMYHVVAPGAHFTPAVQDRYTLHTVWGHTLDVIIECTEFLAYLFDILYKIREFQGKFQISAVSDSLDRASKIARLAVTQFTLASLTGSPPSWKVSGKKYGRKRPSVYFTFLISLNRRKVAPFPNTSNDSIQIPIEQTRP